MVKDRIHPIDGHVGRRLRAARVARGASQTELAKVSGITFQQVQKYEKGTNRVSASRLSEFAAALGVDISYFFADAQIASTAAAALDPLEVSLAPTQKSARRLDRQILMALSEIDNPKLKSDLLRLIDDLRDISAGAPGAASCFGRTSHALIQEGIVRRFGQSDWMQIFDSRLTCK